MLFYISLQQWSSMTRILFVASLHHPQELLKQTAQTPAGARPPLFPSSMALHFWEKAMRRQGYTLEVFWRNLPGFGSQDIAHLQAHKHSERLTPGKVVSAALRRLPPQANPDYRRRNDNLRRTAREFQPDILWLMGDNTIIYPETLSAIQRQTGCKLVYASGTSPIVFSHLIERQAARLYDLVLVNDYYHGIQWLELGAKKMACLPFVAIDPEFHQPQVLTPDEETRYQCDVSFVGTLVPRQLYSERVAALEALRDFQLGIWSVHDMPESLRPFWRGDALGASMLRVLSGATICLNPHGDFMRYGGNMRLFEAAAVGAFQIVDNRPGVAHWFIPNEHLVIYHHLAELRDKVAYFLAHPAERQQMADAARAHVLQHHTYAVRLEQVMALLYS